MPWKPDCFDCSEAEIDPGYSATRTDPGEPASIADCPMNREVGEDIDWDKIGPETCKHFKPLMAGKCRVCKAEINEPMHTWPLVMCGWEDHEPVCSDRCRATYELREYIWRWKEKIYDWKEKTGQIQVDERFYCPDCGLEVFPFQDDLMWWITDGGKIHVKCLACNQCVIPENVIRDVEIKIPYSEAKVS